VYTVVQLHATVLSRLDSQPAAPKVRELTGVSGFDGQEAHYYRDALNENGDIDGLHGNEAWYDKVLEALLPLV